MSTAQGQVAAGGTIELITPGGTAHYVGNWAVSTTGTSASAPVTIEAAAGLSSQPVLDGNNGASNGCSTTSCDGPVLTVPSGEFVALSGITIADGDNTSITDGLGDSVGGGLDNTGTVAITGSAFTGNTAFDGGAIDSGDGAGGGSMAVAGDVFDGSCAQMGGTWADGGYNAGSDGSCFNGGTGNVNAGSSSALELGTLADNGGPTQTIMPPAGSPVTGIIPDPTTVTVGGSPVALCPATDQRGYPSARGTACDAGAVQTSGSAPALALKDSAAPGSFNAAGQLITYSYQVSNTGTGTLTGITVTDPAVPGISCPSATLTAGTSEMCTGTYTTTSVDLAAGKITDTATAAATTAGGVPVASNTATVTVPKGWPPVVTGTHRPAAGAAEGYYLGVTNNTWQLLVTHPGTAKVSFTGRISVPAGTLGNLTLINPTAGHQVSSTGRALTFTLPDYGKVTGFSFTTTAKSGCTALIRRSKTS